MPLRIWLKTSIRPRLPDCHPEHPLSYEPSGLQTAELSIAVGLANCSRWADAQLHRGWPYTSREGWPFTRQSDPDHEVERVCQDQSMSIHPEAAGHHWPITLSDPSNDARRHEGEHRSLLEVRPIYWQSCLGLVVPGAGRVPQKRAGRLPASTRCAPLLRPGFRSPDLSSRSGAR